MTFPTHDPSRTEKDRARSAPVTAHFWINDTTPREITSEPHEIRIGGDPDYGGVSFHIADGITFTVDESDLLEAIAKALRQ